MRYYLNFHKYNKNPRTDFNENSYIFYDFLNNPCKNEKVQLEYLRRTRNKIENKINSNVWALEENKKYVSTSLNRKFQTILCYRRNNPTKINNYYLSRFSHELLISLELYGALEFYTNFK